MRGHVVMITSQKIASYKDFFSSFGLFLKKSNFLRFLMDFPQIRAFRCCLQLKLIMLPQKKWGELQANSKKKHFKAFKVTISEVP